MISLLSRLAQRRKTRGAPSAVLASLVEPSVWGEILIATTDRRLLAQKVAAARGCSEVDVLGKIARATRYPMVELLDPRPSYQCALPVTDEELESRGAIIHLTPEGSPRIVCVLPELLGAEILARVPDVSLAPWTLIQRAWATIAPALSTQSSTLATQAIQHILGYAEEHGATEVELRCAEPAPSYQFRTSDNLHAEGSLAPILAAHLNEALPQNLIDLQREHDITLTNHTNGLFTIARRRLRLERRSAESAPLRLCAPASLAHTAQNCANAEPPIDSPSGTILIIEDNEMFATVLKRFIAPITSGVHWSASGPEAIQHLTTAENLPRCIICDLHMPGMNGLEVIDKLRSDPRLESTPIIVLTSDGDDELAAACLTRGADLFVQKQRDPRVLAAHIRRFLRQSPERVKIAL